LASILWVVTKVIEKVVAMDNFSAETRVAQMVFLKVVLMVGNVVAYLVA